MTLRTLTAAALSILATTHADAALRVVATTPEYAAIATTIGGDKVSVLSLAKPTEDPHFVDAKPSHIITLNRADVLIEGGADLEVGWLPPLVEGARNTKINAGAPGRLRASEGIQLLDVPAVLDRSLGDLHAAGNPDSPTWHSYEVPITLILKHVSEELRAGHVPEDARALTQGLLDSAEGPKETARAVEPR